MLIDHFRIDLYVYKLPLLSLKNYSDVNIGIRLGTHLKSLFFSIVLELYLCSKVMMMMNSMITFVSELSYVQFDTHDLFCDSSFKTALDPRAYQCSLFPILFTKL